MPLSEYEQRVLAQMEQHLRSADPGLEESLRPKGGIDMRKLSIGILGGIIGLAILVAGVATTQVWLGVVGFVAMLAGVLYATTGLRRGPSLPGRASTAPRKSNGFMNKQRERWEKRQGDQS